MTTEVRTPFGAPTRAVELSGGLFRKQILRFDTINYTGRDGKQRRITFDEKYGKDLVEAFRNRAYDQVTFQIADKDNRHTNDPTRTGGEVVGIELTNDGVDAVLRLWGPGQQVIENNPKLGVSARILENLTKSDGRTFPRALQHVLGTVDPQMDGMRPWERVSSVELSGGSVSELLDLSNATYEGSTGMPNENDQGGTVTLELSTAQAERLQRLLDEDEAVDELAAQLEAMGIDLSDDGDEDEDDNTDEDEDDDNREEVDLSSPDTEAIELARAELASQNTRILELSNQLAAQRTDAEIAGYQARGLAPAVLELARPLLAVESGAVELSNGVYGEAVDPGQVLRDTLDAVIELSQSGHLMVDPDSEDGSLQGSDATASERQLLLTDWENYG